MNKDERPVMVTIRCITYNHEHYIRQCLDGFVMQKTNFRYEIVIHDDASTDRTAAIIREYVNKYPELFIPVFEEENQYNNWDFVVEQINANIHGKYVAMCEGDDYWTDPLKLQKQVDFLEAHPDYGLVYTAYREERNGILGKVIMSDFGDDCLREYLSHKGGIIATASTMFRADLYNKMSFDSHLPMGDVPLWIQLMHSSKAKFLSDDTTVYRFLQESACHSRSYKKTATFGKSAIMVRKYYAEKYGYLDIASNLQKREKKVELLICLYDMKIWHFFISYPWNYDIGIRDVLYVLKRRILD